MSFCFLYNIVTENYSAQNSPWGGAGGRGSIASSRSNWFPVLCVLLFSCRLNYARTKNQRTFCLDIASAEILFVSPAKQQRDICIAFPAASLLSAAAA